MAAKKPKNKTALDIDDAMVVKPSSLSDLVLDNSNANAGTERGRTLIERSLENYGAGRSVLIDKNNRVIAGNKTVEVALEKGFGLRIVETTGEELIAVQRTDLDLRKDKSARELAYADNRVGQADLLWNADQIIKDIDDGLGLDGFFDKEELDLFRAEANEGKGSPAGGGPDNEGAPTSNVKVVQLFFNEANYPDFIRAVDVLSKRLGTEDITSTVVAGVRNQANLLLLNRAE